MNSTVRHKIAFALRFAFALIVVATTMAVACPQPEPELPDNGNGSNVTKSDSRVSFESSVSTGLYLMKTGKSVIYDEKDFQLSTNHIRKTFRVQADDQESYVNVVFTVRIPQKAGDEAVARITYRFDSTGETVAIVKLTAVMAKDERLWLWNEMQQLGVIVPEF